MQVRIDKRTETNANRHRPAQKDVHKLGNARIIDPIRTGHTRSHQVERLEAELSSMRREASMLRASASAASCRAAASSGAEAALQEELKCCRKLQVELGESCIEAIDKCKEAESARAQAENARSEAERARVEAERARAEAESALAELMLKSCEEVAGELSRLVTENETVRCAYVWRQGARRVSVQPFEQACQLHGECTSGVLQLAVLHASWRFKHACQVLQAYVPGVARYVPGVASVCARCCERTCQVLQACMPDVASVRARCCKRTCPVLQAYVPGVASVRARCCKRT
eukprot:365987-Chlamydomonas_euryale.AAC.20